MMCVAVQNGSEKNRFELKEKEERKKLNAICQLAGNNNCWISNLTSKYSLHSNGENITTLTAFSYDINMAKRLD